MQKCVVQNLTPLLRQISSAGDEHKNLRKQLWESMLKQKSEEKHWYLIAKSDLEHG